MPDGGEPSHFIMNSIATMIRIACSLPVAIASLLSQSLLTTGRFIDLVFGKLEAASAI
jgi:hypothetical protein